MEMTRSSRSFDLQAKLKEPGGSYNGRWLGDLG